MILHHYIRGIKLKKELCYSLKGVILEILFTEDELLTNNLN